AGDSRGGITIKDTAGQSSPGDHVVANGHGGPRRASSRDIDPPVKRSRLTLDEVVLDCRAPAGSSPILNNHRHRIRIKGVIRDQCVGGVVARVKIDPDVDLLKDVVVNLIVGSTKESDGISARGVQKAAVADDVPAWSSIEQMDRQVEVAKKGAAIDEVAGGREGDPVLVWGLVPNESIPNHGAV